VSVYERTSAWTLTALRSLPKMAHHPGVDSLAGVFDSVPWVQVAPGPSLDRNVDELHRIKGRGVICAVTHAVSRLTEAGIVPDIVVGCEERDQRHYVDMADLSRSMLVLDAKCHPAMWDVPAGRKALYSSTVGGDWLPQAIGGDVRLYGGNTVASPSLLLGRLLGCKPIVLVGHDLAYRRVESDDGPAIQQYACATPRSDWNDRLVRVPGIDGGDVMTPQTFRRQIEWLAERASESLIVDATEGGALIEGSMHRNPITGEVLRLSTVADDLEDREVTVDAWGDIGAALEDFDSRAQRGKARRWCIDVERDLRAAAKSADVLERAALAGKPAIFALFHWANARDMVRRDVANGDLLASLVDAPVATSIMDANMRASTARERVDADVALAKLIRRSAATVCPILRDNAVELAR
jgi:uncharacterized Rossmann fold enzyme